jgi:hypothetical protein
VSATVIVHELRLHMYLELCRINSQVAERIPLVTWLPVTTCTFVVVTSDGVLPECTGISIRF